MNLEPLFAHHRDRLRDCAPLPEVFAGHGLTLAQLQGFDLGLDEHGNGVIALRALDGRLLGLKVPLLHAGSHKYLEIPSPNGNPPWFPDTRETLLSLEYDQAMMTQIPPRLDSLPLRRGQKVLLGVSAGVLVASALVLWHFVPLLPASIPTHWSGSSTPDGYGPPSTLWGLWAVMLGMWAVLGLLAWQAPSGKFPLNGMPPITPRNAPHVLGELRTAFLIFQCIVMLIFSSIIAAVVVYSLGGPNLIALSLLLVVLVPLGIGYSLFRVSAAAQR